MTLQHAARRVRVFKGLGHRYAIQVAVHEHCRLISTLLGYIPSSLNELNGAHAAVSNQLQRLKVREA